MARYEGIEFRNRKIPIDNQEFHRCIFRHCEIVYSGMGPISMSHNQFFECRFAFGGPAANTIEYLRSLYTMATVGYNPGESVLRYIAGQGEMPIVEATDDDLPTTT